MERNETTARLYSLRGFHLRDALIMNNSSFLEFFTAFNQDNGYDISQLSIQNVRKIHVDDNMMCSICLESFRLRQKVYKLDCNHMLHRHCGRNWLIPNGTCPMCRSRI